MHRFFIFLLIFTGISYGLTLDKAMELALKNHPYIKQERAFLQTQRYDYYSSYGNLLPSVSFNYTYSRYSGYEPDDYFSRSYSIGITWNIYDSGQSIMLTRIKKYLFSSRKEDFQETVLDIIYQVKKTYYLAAANREIVNVRRTQLKAAEKNYQMAKKKLRLGLVTKADYLQAKVRYENVRYQLEAAENNYKKSIAELNSLMGLPLDTDSSPEPDYLKRFEKDHIPPFKTIEEIAFKRPVFRQYNYQLKAARMQTLQSMLSFTPSVFLSFSENRDYNSLYGDSDSYNVTRIGLSWTIFSGLQRYYNYLSSKENERYYRYRIQELKRQIRLNLYSYYLDLKSAYRNLDVAKTLLKEAKENYRQALGEYRAGKGDIISLVTAESALASAKETYIQSLLNIAVTRAMMEREMGIKNLSEEGNSR
ncbi:TolC family protein [Persephonella sp.]